jgi:hypothetical protein
MLHLIHFKAIDGNRPQNLTAHRRAAISRKNQKTFSSKAHAYGNARDPFPTLSVLATRVNSEGGPQVRPIDATLRLKMNKSDVPDPKAPPLRLISSRRPTLFPSCSLLQGAACSLLDLLDIKRIHSKYTRSCCIPIILWNFPPSTLQFLTARCSTPVRRPPSPAPPPLATVHLQPRPLNRSQNTTRRSTCRGCPSGSPRASTATCFAPSTSSATTSASYATRRLAVPPSAPLHRRGHQSGTAISARQDQRTRSTR